MLNILWGNCSFSRRKLVLLGRIGSFQLRNWFHGNVSYSRRNEHCIPLLEGTDAMTCFAVWKNFFIARLWSQAGGLCLHLVSAWPSPIQNLENNTIYLRASAIVLLVTQTKRWLCKLDWRETGSSFFKVFLLSDHVFLAVLICVAHN